MKNKESNEIKKTDWISGVKAAGLLGFSNVKAILRLPIPHLEMPMSNGKTVYRYDLKEVLAYKNSVMKR
jgi:hypothetical protein